MKKLLNRLLDWIAPRLIGWIIASTALMVASMWLISASYRAPVGEEQPKVTDWMQAWGSIFGVFAGLAAAAAAALLLMHERRRAEEAERQLEDSALDVPRAVTVTPARFGTFGSKGDRIHQVILSVHNYGAGAIRNIAVVVTLPEDGRHLILPYVELLGPVAVHEINHSYSGNGIHVPGPWVPSMGEAPVTVCFIDHMNRAWEKTSDGKVSRTIVPYPLVAEAAKSSAAPALPRRGQ